MSRWVVGGKRGEWMGWWVMGGYHMGTVGMWVSRRLVDGWVGGCVGRKEDGKRNGWMKCSWMMDDRHPGPKTKPRLILI